MTETNNWIHAMCFEKQFKKICTEQFLLYSIIKNQRLFKKNKLQYIQSFFLSF